MRFGKIGWAGVALALVQAVPVVAAPSPPPGVVAEIKADQAEVDQAKLLAQAFTLVNQGKPAEAEAIFSAVIAEKEAQAKPGQVYFCADNFADMMTVSMAAGKLLQPGSVAVVQGPNWCDALFGEGFALIDLNRSSEAEPFLARAVEMAPTNAHYLNEYAEWYKAHHQWQKAHDLFARAWDIVDQDKKGPDRRIAARALRGMGFTLIELGNLDDAERQFKLSLKYEPEAAGKVQGELDYIAQQRAALKKAA